MVDLQPFGCNFDIQNIIIKLTKKGYSSMKKKLILTITLIIIALFCGCASISTKTATPDTATYDTATADTVTTVETTIKITEPTTEPTIEPTTEKQTEPVTEIVTEPVTEPIKTESTEEKSEQYVYNETDTQEDTDCYDATDEPVIKNNTPVTYKNNYEDSAYTNTINGCDVPWIKPGQTVGYITCNKANINYVPITIGADQATIDSHPVGMMHIYTNPRYFGTGNPAALFGHNTWSFGQLQNLAIGDTIEINTVYNANFLYRVTYVGITRLGSDMQSEYDINTGENMIEWNGTTDILQLCTCADHLGYNNNYRLFVKAELYKGTTIIQ